MTERVILCPFSGKPCICGEADAIVQRTAYFAFREPATPSEYQAAVDKAVGKAIKVHNAWAGKSATKSVADNNALLAPNMASRCPFYQA